MTIKITARKGLKKPPRRDVFFAAEGTGKSTYGAGAPNPVFLDLEQSTGELDVACIENDGKPLGTYEEVLEVLEWLRASSDADLEAAFGFVPKTLVIDTADAACRLIDTHVCRINNWASLKSAGYGKGTDAFNAEFRSFVAALERLQIAKGVHLVILAHASIKKVSPPDADPFDRYDFRAPEASANLLREWSDLILYGEKYRADKKTPEVRRVRTEGNNAAVAKNRIGLPSLMPLTRDLWDQVEKVRNQDPAEIVAGLLEGHPGLKDKTLAWFAGQPDKRHAIEVVRQRIAALDAPAAS